MKFFSLIFTTFLILAFGVSDAGILKAHILIAKGNFYGKVLDAVTKAPIQGVSVYFSDIKVGGTTDANGNFNFKNLPEGKHLIEISHVGYTSVIENIDISGDTKKDYVLTESIVENNAVIVTGVGT
jgi:iron complex outermembrane receptor protein